MVCQIEKKNSTTKNGSGSYCVHSWYKHGLFIQIDHKNKHNRVDPLGSTCLYCIKTYRNMLGGEYYAYYSIGVC